MAEKFQPQTFDINSINGGDRYENGQGIGANSINAPIEAAAYVQSLATNQPNIENADKIGTPSVSIELANGTPRFKFENLKGKEGKDHSQEISAIREEQIEQNTQIEETKTEVHNIKQALLQNEVLVVSKIPNKTVSRVTANGENIVDDQYTPVLEIKGSTARCENLIPYPYIDTTKTANGLTFTDNGDGSITVNGTATATTTFALYVNRTKIPTGFAAGKSYTLSGGVTNGYIQVNIYRGGNEEAWIYSNETKTKTLDETIEGLHIYIAVLNGTTVNNKTFYPMVNEGSTALPYQPYFTGLKHAHINSIKSTGRNLFDSSLLLKANGWEENNGVYTGHVAYLYQTFGLSVGGLLGKLNIDRQMTIAFSARTTESEAVTNATLFAYIVYTDGTRNEVSIPSEVGDFNRYSVTSTVGKTIYAICFSYGSGGTVEIKDLCIKYGDDTTYEPYTEELYELPETLELGEFDNFNPQTGELTKATKKTTFTGGEGWKTYRQTPNSHGAYTYFLSTSDKVIGVNAAICNQFISSDYAWDLQGAGYFADHPTLRTLYFNSNLSTLEEWKAYLAELYANGTPVVVDYKVETPTIEKIENVPKQYKAWNHGSETIIQGETDNSVYGAMPTVTNEYILKIGGEE